MPWNDPGALTVRVVGSGDGCWDYRVEAPWRRGYVAAQSVNMRLKSAWNQGQQAAWRKSRLQPDDVWLVCESWPEHTRIAVYRAGTCVADSHRAKVGAR